MARLSSDSNGGKGSSPWASSRGFPASDDKRGDGRKAQRCGEASQPEIEGGQQFNPMYKTKTKRPMLPRLPCPRCFLSQADKQPSSPHDPGPGPRSSSPPRRTRRQQSRQRRRRHARARARGTSTTAGVGGGRVRRRGGGVAGEEGGLRRGCCGAGGVVALRQDRVLGDGDDDEAGGGGGGDRGRARGRQQQQQGAGQVVVAVQEAVGDLVDAAAELVLVGGAAGGRTVRVVAVAVRGVDGRRTGPTRAEPGER